MSHSAVPNERISVAPAAMEIHGQQASKVVMAGLVPAIHVFVSAQDQDVDARDERGHDIP